MHRNPFSKMARRTGCEIAVRFHCQRNAAFKFTGIEPSGLPRLEKCYTLMTGTVHN